MTLSQFKIMLELSKTRSINQAAKNLFMSQPNLSTAIHKLEEELRCPLIIRSKKGVSFTPQGKQFVEYAESILSQIEHLQQVCRTYGTENPLSLSVSSMHFKYAVVAASQMMQRYKNNPFNLSLREGAQDQVLDDVRQGRCDIGLIYILGNYKKTILQQIRSLDVQYYRLSSNPPAVVVGKGNPLYYLDEDIQLTPDMLDEYTQLSYEQMDFGHFSDKDAMLNIKPPRHRIIVNSRAAMYELLETIPAYTVTSNSRTVYQKIEYYSNARVFYLDQSTSVCEIGWLKKRNTSLSPLALKYLNIVTSYFENL